MQLNKENLPLDQWLAQEPPTEWIETKNGGQYLPIEIVKALLDYVTPYWGTKNFHHFFFQPLDGSWRCSGSVELQVDYAYNGELGTNRVQRNITGAATFDTAEYDSTGDRNPHYAMICLSLCIVAAAKEIAPIFGKNLNKEVEENKINNTLKNLGLKQ